MKKIIAIFLLLGCISVNAQDKQTKKQPPKVIRVIKPADKTEVKTTTKQTKKEPPKIEVKKFRPVKPKTGSTKKKN